ncbi:leucine-rich repeat protein [uncultured Ruminococcus sp.]|uniref:leucine-rich repeat protein n=1 Tax=uncultured Ruminococcus sp. TaxID=165186 RepID=UPI0025CF65C9|nr:leucine-rich repeat protein [uncultured Ruminococcus sp.]
MMKNKLLAVTLAVLLFSGSAVPQALYPASATVYAEETGYSEVSDGILTYHVYSDHAEVAACELPDFANVAVPASIKDVPVTVIGENAFYDVFRVTRIRLPETITVIGDYAFASCGNMTAVNIPDSVTEIGDSAFYNCSGLTELTIPDSVTKIGSKPFYGCHSLTSVALPDTVTRIGDAWFYDCPKLEAITLPDSVTEIGASAFVSCSSLTSVTIPASVGRINDYAFSRCTALAEVAFSPSAALTYIGDHAFSSCESLASIELPASVAHLGDQAFGDCTALEAFTLPASLRELGENVFERCTALAACKVDPKNAYFTDVNGVLFTKDRKELCVYPPARPGESKSDTNCESYRVPYGTERIGAHAFQYACTLVDVWVPATVSYIGKEAFYNCRYMLSLSVVDPDCVFEEGTRWTICNSGGEFNGIVYGHEGSTTQSFAQEIGLNFGPLRETPIRMTEGDLSFDVYPDHAELCDCSEDVQGEVTVPAMVYDVPVTKLAFPSFSNSTGITAVNLPGTLKEIGFCAFEGCTGLTAIELPDSVTMLDEYSFSGCTALTSVKLSGAITAIPDRCFQGCGFKEFTIPDTITSIGLGAFAECGELTSLTIPESVTSIGDVAFIQTGLTSVTIPGSVKELGEAAFMGCADLTSADLPYGLKSVSKGLFSGCTSLEAITIPGTVTSIEKGAFNTCSSLTAVTIPRSVETVGEGAFSSCRSLKSVTVLSPDCEIYDTEDTIAYYLMTTIRGYEGSTAQAYAQKYHLTFEVVSAPETVVGDINDDGMFSIADIILLQKWLLAVPDTYLANWKAADFYVDDKLDVFDLCMMKRALISNET